MQPIRNYGDRPALARITLILISTVCILLLLRWGKFLFIPLFLAFLFAVFLYPITKFFEKKHFSKMMAAATSVLLFFLFVCIVGYFFSAQLSQFIKALPEIKDKLDILVQKAQAWVSANYHINGDNQAGYLNSSINKLFSFAGDTIGVVLEG